MRTSKNGKALKLISSAQITLSKIYDAYTINLSNSNFDIVCNDQGDALAGEIGANGRAITTTSVVMGTKKLTAVASNPTAEQYCISISAQVGCIAAKNGNDKVYINTLSNSIAGKISISFNIEGTTTVVKDVTFVKKMNDSPNFIDGQFSFGTGYWSTTQDGTGVLGSNVTIKKSNESIYGTNLLEIANETWFYSKKNINIEKDRIYRCRFRAKQSIDNTTGGKIAYFGYTPYNSSGAAIGTNGANNMYFKNEALKTNAWTEWEYYVSTKARTEVSTTVNGVKKVITPAVQAFPTGAVKFQPMFIINYQKGNGIALADGWILEDVTEKFEISQLEYKASQIETTVNGIDANVVTIKTYTDMSSNPMTLAAKANYSAYDTPNQGEVYLHGLNDKRNPADIDGKCIWNAKTVSLPKVMFNPNSVVPDGIAIYMVRNISDNKWWSVWKETNNSTTTWKRTLADVNTSATVYTHTWNETNDIVVGYYIVKKTNPRDGEAPIVIAQLFDGALNYKQATSMTLVGSISQLEILENEVNLKVANTDNKVSQLKLEADKITQRVQTTETNVSTVTNNLNNLKIGGKNLLPGTKEWNKAKGAGIISSETYQGLKVLYKDNSSASSSTYVDIASWGDVVEVKPNTEYTLSFYAKGTGRFTSYFHPSNVASGYSSEGVKTTATDGSTTHNLTSGWKKYWITWKTLSNATGNKNVIAMRLWGGNIGYICAAKLEEGNKATDWSPSPEDVNSDINNAIDKITIGGRNLIKKKSQFTYGYISAENKGAVNNSGSLNSNQDFYTNEYFKVNQGETIYFSSYTKGINSNIQAAVYIHFYNLNKVWQKAISKITSANQNAQVSHKVTEDCYVRFSTRGFNDYNHKAEYGTKPTDWTPAPEDVDNAIANVNTKVESTTSKLSELKLETDKITQRVQSTESKVTTVTNDFNNLKIGGNNVLRNGNFEQGLSNWSTHDMTSSTNKKSIGVVSGGDWAPSDKKVLQIWGDNVPDRYGVISSTIKLIPKTQYTISGYCAGHRVGYLQVNVRDANASMANVHYHNITPVSGGKTLDKWHRFETTFTTTSNTDFALNLYAIDLATNGHVWFCDVQIQQGTKASAWMPCSLDIDSSIANVDSKIETTKNKVAEITTNLDGISLKVQSTEQTVSNHTTQLSTVDNRINSAKNAAINTAASDATSKVDSAKNELNTTINNIKIGGRNLAQLTSNAYSTAFSGFNGGTNTCRSLATVLTDGLQVGDTVTVRLLYKYTNIVSADGQTAKCCIQGAGNVTEWNSGAFHNPGWKTINGSGEIEFLYNFKVIAAHLKNTSWGVNIRHDYVKSGSVQWKSFKVEKGDKATDWTPAPEDINAAINKKANSADVYTKSEVYTKAQADSAIEIAKDAINLSVSQNYETKTNVESKINSAVNNVQVGGRNLLVKNALESGNISGVNGSVLTGTYENFYRTKNFIDIKNDSKYTLKVNKGVSGDIIEKIVAYNSTGAYISTHTINAKQIVFTPPANCTKIKFIVIIANANASTIIEKFNIKLESGTKATDWTAAPEDVDSSISSVQSQVATTNNKVATIETNLSGITQRVSSSESTISTHTTQLGTVDSRINTAKNAAISTAAADATTKANNAQSKALADAKSYTSGQITTVNQTISNRYSELKSTTDSITQKVSATETKVNTVTASFNNLQVGGKNLILDTSTPVINSSWSSNGWSGSISAHSTNTYKLIAINGWRVHKYKLPSDYVGKTITISFYAKLVSSETTSTTINKISVCNATGTNPYPSSEFTMVGNTGTSDLPVKDTWIYCYSTVVLNADAQIGIGVRCTPESQNLKTTWLVKDLKVEIGNKATDWTPAPEDINKSIANVDNKVISTNSKVASIETNLSGITQKVSSTETKVNSITTSFNNLQIGGRNLFLKSDINKYGVGCWERNGSGVGIVEGTYIDETKTMKLTGNEGIRYNPYIKLKRNTTYTYSMMMKSSGAIAMSNSTPLHMWLKTATDSENSHLETIISKSGSIPANVWTKVWISFKTPNSQDTYYMKPFVYGISSNTVYITKVKVEEGEKATDWSPAPEDIDSAITSVDNKVTTTNSKVATIETNLSSITQRVSSTETTTSTLTTNMNNKEDKNNRVIYARGAGNDYPGHRILKIGNTTIYSTGGRGARVTALVPSTLAVYSDNTYDLHVGGDQETNFINKINELNNGDYIIVVTSCDNAYLHYRLRCEALYKIGGFAPNTSLTGYREAYALIGRSKLGKGNGVEMYIPKTETDKRFAEVSVKVNDDGAFMGVNSSNIGHQLDTVDSKVETTKQQVSEISTSLNGITLKVQSTEQTVANHTTQLNQVDNKVSNAINNLQIGGRNIATETNRGVTGWNWAMSVGGRSITEVVENGIKCCKMVRDNVAATGWSYISYSRIGRNKYVAGRTYTVSFEVKSSVPTSFWCHFLEGNSSNGMHTAGAKATVSETNKWTKLVFTLTMKDTLPTSTSQLLYLNSMDSSVGVTYIFRNLMIEEGTKASAWSPAPEDIDSSIANVNTKVDTSMSQIEMLNNKIGLKVEKNNVIASINLYTQTNENGSSSGIKIKGDKVDLQGQVTFSSLADSNASGSIKNIFTQQNNQTVINGGMIKTQTIKGNDLLLKGNLTVTDSGNNKTFEITSNGDVNIQAKSLRIGSANVATNNDISNAVNNLQIGGKNLLKDSDFIVQATSSAVAPTKTISFVNGLDLNVALLNKTVTFSYYVHCPGDRTNGSGSLGNRFGIHGSIQWKNSSTGATRVDYPFADCLTGSYNKQRVAMTISLKPPSGFDIISSFSFSFQPLAKPNSSEVWKIGQPKLEIGNKATDWTPAPEDTIAAINSKVNNTQEAIFNKLFANGQQGFVLESGKVYINGEVIKANVISGTAIKAGTLDASKIKAGIIQASAGGSYLDLNNGSMMLGTTSLSNYLQWTGSQLNIKANSISIGSSALATTTDINNAIKNVQIGGRNLILNSALNGNSNWTGTVSIDTSKKCGNCNSLKFTGSASAYSNSIPAKVGDVFTVSVKSFVGTSGGSLPLIIFEEYKDNTTNRINYQETTVSSTLNSWQDYAQTWTVKNAETTNVRIRIYNRTASYNFWASQPKLEKGNKATDWTPASEDIESSINGKVNNTQEAIFNKLFSNGQQGFVLENGKVYINGEVIKANAIRGSVISAINMSSESATINSAQIGNLDASKITTGFISANRLDASTLVSKINGGYTSISGNKIRTGIIRANSGGSYIDLDDGTMQLGTTSKSNYLQWNGSTLTIKGHLNTCTFRGKNMVYIEDNGTLSCDGQTYIRHLSVLETHPGWASGTRGSFDCAPTANFAKEVRTKGEFWAANNTSTYLGVIRRGAGGTGYIQIDRMRVVNQKHGSANNYMEVVGYNSNHVFGIDLWSSDKKLKENIVSLEDNHVELLNDDTSKTGLNLINNLNHYAYDYKKSFGGDHVTCGYVAQELQELNDSLVMEIEQQDGTTLLQPKASNIIPNLSLAIKQQQKMIDDLKAEIELLKSKLNN